jgi:hypothetical protein
MADDSWVLVERFDGQMRRVTVLDEGLHVIATHERPGAAVEGTTNDCQLLRAVKLERADTY